MSPRRHDQSLTKTGASQLTRAIETLCERDVMPKRKRRLANLDDQYNSSETHFDDKVKVHTAPSGTQYIDPVDLFLTRELLIQIRKKVEERLKQKELTPKPD